MEIHLPKKGSGFKFFLATLLMFCGGDAICQLKANFTAVATSGCAPLTVTFQDISTGSPISWQWDLGNGNLSNKQAPSTSYFNAGTYTVSLKITGVGGKDSITKINYITVYDNPVVNFSASIVSGCFPLAVNFSDFSSSGSGDITKWSWDLGDGNISSLQNPMHIYTATGNYSVTLKATNNNGCSKVISKAQYIKVTDGAVASFANSSPVHCSPPETIGFTNISTGPAALSYAWAFGDGSTSAEQNPSHTYNSAGTYSVQLVVKSSAGCIDTLFKKDSIVIRNYQTNFSGPDSVCINATAGFSNISTPSPKSFHWNLGDSIISSQAVITKAWSVPGIYPVKLVNNYGVCIDSVIKQVKVVSLLVGDFTAADSFNCKAPFTTQFRDMTAGSTKWSWAFGDGGTSIEQNPTHTYNISGQFDVTLTVTNSAGCTSTVTKKKYINTTRPYAAIDSLPTGGCIPFTYNAIANIRDPKGVNSYLWDFGDGSTSVDPNPTHIYLLMGTYKVKLYFTTNDGCSDSVVTNNSIKTGTPPTVDFTASPLSQCVGQDVHFTDISIPADTWLWSFGDGTSSTVQNPVHQYKSNGVFSVKLTATNNGCSASITKNDLVTILPPLSKFTVSFDCIDKTQVFFKDNSAFPQAWLWDFGDGTTSTVQNPVHKYAALGTYNVTLTVTKGICDNAKTTTIKLVNEHADFSTPKDSVCRNIPVLFTAINSNAVNISNYTFDYGDGNIVNSVSKTASHIYTTPGTYTVKLTITDINGCKDSITKKNYITVVGPTADFSALSLIGCKGLDVAFTDNSTTDGIHPISNWQWDYGDGIVESLSTPPFNHIFDSAGSFSVTLKVTDVNGCFDNFTFGKPVIIKSPVVDFTAADTLACIGSNILINNASYGDTLSYFWALGNGFTSMKVNPFTSYPAVGNYTIKLVATDIHGCKDSLQKNDYIRISIPKAGFSINDSVGSCSPFEVSFTNNSINYLNQTWNFGDESSSRLINPVHYYSTPGTYIATLYASLPGGCVDSFKRTIILHSSDATISYAPLFNCSSINVNFHVSTASVVSYFWDFGDGNTLSTTDSNTIHTYQSPGNFVPKVILTNPAGCQLPLTGINVIHVTKSFVNFGVADSNNCFGAAIHFIDSTKSNISIAKYNWDFGDGTTSLQQIPVHLYAAAGTYTVRLIVTTTDGCMDTLVKNNYIHVYNPVANFGVSSLRGCKAVSDINFIDNSVAGPLNTIVNWQWNYGDNIIENDSAAPFNHIYKTVGTFMPQVKITDSYGCSSSYNLKTPIIVTDPKASFNSFDTSVCLGRSVRLNNMSTGSNLGYTWLLASETISNEISPSITYASEGSYSIRLIVTDLNSCTDTLERDNYINVHNVSKATISGITTYCAMDMASFNGILVNGDSSTVKWQWDFGNGNTSSLQNTLPQQYSKAGNFPVRLILTNQSGCRDTANTIATIHPLPSTDGGNNATVCLNNTIQLQATGADEYIWSPSTYLNCVSCSGPLAVPLNSIVYYVKGKNVYGCETTDSIAITVKKPFKLTVTPVSDSLCKGQGVDLVASGGEEYTWFPQTGLTNPFINNPVAIPDADISYKVVGTDKAKCFADSVTINIAVFPYPAVKAGPDKNISFGQSATITPVYSQDIVSWAWSPSTGLSCTDCANPVASPQTSTKYTVTVVNNGGCSAKDDIAVYFPCQVSMFIPNTFSPNSDGVNDFFYPRGKDIYLIQSFIILDRRGEVVFQRSNFNANVQSLGWDGRFKGQPANSDVYTYIVEVVCNNNNISTFKGDVTLIR